MPGAFEICVKTHFSAAHSLKGYPGDCARIHGHNWTTEAFVKCKKLDKIGIGVDFRDVKNSLKNLLQGFDQSNLNDLPAFRDVNPTSENIAKFLYKELSKKLNSDLVKVSKIRVSETPDVGAFYWEE